MDFMLFQSESIRRSQRVCAMTPVQRAYWGFGMVAYLVKYVCLHSLHNHKTVFAFVFFFSSSRFFSRPGARRLLEQSVHGMRGPIDGHVWYHNTVYATTDAYIGHRKCEMGNCRASVRSWLNGDFPDMDYPD